MKEHEAYMRRCLDLAAKGIRNAAPNPMVGAVVVHDGKIIGEGYHQMCGEAHAEVNAINAVKQPELLKEATIYVSLEPCAHHGKTPPCSDLILHHQIPKVVVACRDPFAEVDGKGIQKLQAAGVEVITGVLEKEAQDLNKRFFTFHQKKRPYIILKWAQTLDGFMDKIRSFDEKPHINWITQPETKRLVHQWRSEEQAILVGTNTVILDDPELTVREVSGPNPLRVVLDQNGRIPETAKVFSGEAETLVFHADGLSYPFSANGIPINFGMGALQELLHHLYQKDIQSIIIEGGQQILQSFLAAKLWDEARVLVGETTFGKGLQAPEIQQKANEIQSFGKDRLLLFYPE